MRTIVFVCLCIPVMGVSFLPVWPISSATVLLFGILFLLLTAGSDYLGSHIKQNSKGRLFVVDNKVQGTSQEDVGMRYIFFNKSL